MADTAAQSSYRQDEKYEWIGKLNDLYEEVKRDGECFSLKDLAVNGKDLIGKGITPGKELGDILAAMLSDVIDDPSHNTKEYLLDETNFARFSMKGNE
jgi:tRNA nucleotidyltransferase (CCA-adding enzyme)